MLRVREERCDSCLFRLKYPKVTRDRIMGDCAKMDGFVSCHKHDNAASVVCRGYYDVIGQNGCTAVQLAIRFEAIGMGAVEIVRDGDYPRGGDDDDGDEA